MRVRALVFLALMLPMAHEASAQASRRRVQQGDPAARQQLEQRFRNGMARVVRKRLGLTDDQMTRLAQANARYDARRRDLNREERARRVELRSQLVAGDGANQERIAAALDRVLQLQRERIDLQIEEQRQLATFMSPVQRARYAALQEQIRRRLEGIRAAGVRSPADSE